VSKTVLVLTLPMLLTPDGSRAQNRAANAAIDPVTASPANFKVLLENEYVRVVEHSVRPGERDQWHTHPGQGVVRRRGRAAARHRRRRPIFPG
jgi:quercetin dioxygenase-like cupin family protein